MAFVLITNSSASVGITSTTTGVDTTGATLIILFSSAGAGVTISDNKSNTWTALTQSGTDALSRFFYCINPTVGTGHTFTTTGAYGAIFMQAYSGANPSVSVENGANTASGTSLATGNVIEYSSSELVVTGLGIGGNGNTPAVNIGNITNSINSVTGSHYGGSMAYIIESSRNTRNASWTWTTTSSGSTRIATFKSNSQNWSTTAQIKADNTKVSGASDLTNFPVLIKDGNIPDSVYAGLKTQELNNLSLLTDANIRAYYRFNTGALTTDSSGNAYTLTNTNTVGEGTGKFGVGADLGSSNTNKSLTIASKLGLTNTGAFSVSLWVKLNTEVASGVYAFYEQIVGGATGVAIFIKYEYNAGTRRLRIGRYGSANSSVYNTITLGTSNVYHLVLTYNATTVESFVNAVSQGTSASSGTLNATGYPDSVDIGKNNATDGAGFASAIIDDVSVFSRALTSAEVLKLYQQQGDDLRITTDSAGITEIPYEIVSMDTTAKTAEVWAKIPTLTTATDTSIYLWSGNASAIAYDANAPFGSQAVWSEYLSVHHLETSKLDSTVLANNFTSQGTIATTTMIGNAYTFTPNASLYKKSPAGLNGGMAGAAASVWVKTSTTGVDKVLMIAGDGAGNNTFWAWIQVTAANKILAVIKHTTGADTTLTCTTSVTDNTKHLVHIVYNGTTMKLFIDGVQEGTLNKTGVVTAVDLTNATHGSYSIGQAAGTSNTDWTSYGGFTGSLDEPRLRGATNIANLTADWALTEYNNQNSPSTFWTLASSRRIFNIS